MLHLSINILTPKLHTDKLKERTGIEIETKRTLHFLKATKKLLICKFFETFAKREYNSQVSFLHNSGRN